MHGCIGELFSEVYSFLSLAMIIFTFAFPKSSRRCLYRCDRDKNTSCSCRALLFSFRNQRYSSNLSETPVIADAMLTSGHTHDTQVMHIYVPICKTIICINEKNKSFLFIQKRLYFFIHSFP